VLQLGERIIQATDVEVSLLKARMNELEAKLDGRALPRATQTKADERKGR